MLKTLITFLLVIVSAPVLADDPPQPGAASDKPKPDAKLETPKPDVKTLSGISILGNQEAPKSLVIVPWKSSEIGNGIRLSSSLDGQPTPVDKDVFARQLRYYDIRSRATDSGAGH
jgi:hypothetical protein